MKQRTFQFTDKMKLLFEKATVYMRSMSTFPNGYLFLKSHYYQSAGTQILLSTCNSFRFHGLLCARLYFTVNPLLRPLEHHVKISIFIAKYILFSTTFPETLKNLCAWLAINSAFHSEVSLRIKSKYRSSQLLINYL